MSKTHYTTEEVHQILEELFHEQRKSQLLQQELDTVRQERDEDTELMIGQCESLREMVSNLKGECSRLETELKEERLRVGLHDDTLANLTALNRRLQAQQLEFNDNFQHLQEHNKAQKEQIDLLQATIEEKEKRLAELLEVEISYKKALEDKQALEFDHVALSQQTEELRLEKANAEKKLDEMHLHAEQLDKGMQYLRNKMEEAKLDADQLCEELALSQELVDELKKRLEQDTTEKNQAIIDSSDLKQMNDKYQHDIAVLQAQLKEARRSQEANQQQVSELETKLQQMQQVENDKQQVMVERENRINIMTQEAHRHAETVRHLQMQLEEKDAQMRIAQQHLVKKVKETSLIAEKMEEQKNVILDLQNQVDKAQGKISELRNNLDHFAQHEKKMQDKFNESYKDAEIQLRKTEEKYAQLYAKWLETEKANHELKKVEDKHHHLQSLLSNLGSALGSPAASSTQSLDLLTSMKEASVRSVEDSIPMKDEVFSGIIETKKEEKREEKPSPKLDLFSGVSSPSHFKQNLFE